jgi:alkylhydroperoxidase family enzyme
MSLVPLYVDDASPEQERVAALIRNRRGGILLNLDRALLLSAPFAEGFNGLLPKVRNELSLPPRLRELAICATASLTGAQYELHHHAPVFLKVGGTPSQLAAIATLPSGQPAVSDGLFDDVEHAVLGLVRESTRNVHLSDELADRLKRLLTDDRQIMELIALVATYNMVCRIVVAMGVAIERN